MIRALRRQSECNLWRSLGMGDDACKRGKRGRLSNGASSSTERGRGVSLRRGVGSPAERGARTRASLVLPAPRSAGRRIPSAVVIGVALAIVARHRAHLSAFAARARFGAQRRRARSRHARDAARRAARRVALSADPRASEAEVFRSVLKAHPDERLAQSMLIDRDGRVVEYEGTQDASELAAGGPRGPRETVRSQRHSGRRDPHPDRT